MLAALLLLACGSATISDVQIEIDIDRTSCGITELDDYPLPAQATYAISIVDTNLALLCAMADITTSKDESLADLGTVLDDAGLALEPQLLEAWKGTLIRLRFDIWLARPTADEVGCPTTIFPQLASGESELFIMNDLFEAEEPRVRIPVSCTAPLSR